MFKRFMAVLVLLIIGGTGCWFTSARTAGAGDIYPLQLGNRWNYQLTVNSNSVNREDQVSQQAAIDGTPVLVVQSAYNGTVQQKDYYQVKSDGVFTYLRQMGNYKFRLDIPQIYLKYPVVIGDGWEQNCTFNDPAQKIAMQLKMKCKYLAREKLQVPAGTFDAVKLQLSLETSDGARTEGFRYYSEGVGLVKEDFQLTANGSSLKVVSVLKSYQVSGQ